MDQFIPHQPYSICLLPWIQDSSTSTYVVWSPSRSVHGPTLFLLSIQDLVQLDGLLDCIHTCMPMTPRFVVSVKKVPQTIYSTMSLVVFGRRRLDVVQPTRVECIQVGSTMCASAYRQSQLHSDLLAAGSHLLTPLSSMHYLRIYIDADLTMRT